MGTEAHVKRNNVRIRAAEVNLFFCFRLIVSVANISNSNSGSGIRTTQTYIELRSSSSKVCDTVLGARITTITHEHKHMSVFYCSPADSTHPMQGHSTRTTCVNRSMRSNCVHSMAFLPHGLVTFVCKSAGGGRIDLVNYRISVS